ncbi:MAG TPA: type IV pilus modification protein PilV [Steroidobacteraceae bacterium]|nr:type IV pilus modification protein PilV [Steroidobacteraceae bacterium]
MSAHRGNARRSSGERRGARLAGFSLVEVMVALAVITVGLLGVAKMQALALASTTSASQRAMAALEASSLAAMMHTNRSYWSASPPQTINVSAASITSSTGGFPPSATQNCTPSVSSPASTAPCNPTTLAAYDLQQWQAALNNLLPNALAAISCSTNLAAPPLSCSITISWSENAVAINSTEATASQSNNQNGDTAQFQNSSYTLYVDP